MWQVYKDYDGYAPDTPPVIITEDKQVAMQTAEFLNDMKDEEKDGCLAYSEGHEWNAAWQVREYHGPTVVNTIEEAKDAIFNDMADVIRDDAGLDTYDEARKAFDEMWG